MSPIARVFSVLNLILAASFLAWASTTLAHSQDYKRKYESEQAAHQTTTNEKDAHISELETLRDSARNEAETLRGERDGHEERANRLEGDLSQKSSELSQAMDINRTNSLTAESKDRDLQTAQEKSSREVEARHEAEGAKESAEEAQQEAESNYVDAQDEIESLNNTVSDKEAEIVALNRTISELETQLTTVVELTGVSFDQITAQPAIDATVVRAIHDNSLGLVALNRGSEAGVKVGYTFEIYNGGQYKGQVRVENVRPNMCTALVTTAVSGAQIGQGDSAATRL